jgi:hypothetical protein
LKGLPDFLDTQTQALIADRPLFQMPKATAAADDETDVVSSSMSEEHKPYSLRERAGRTGSPPNRS